MFCTACGTELYDPDLKVCYNCGSRPYELEEELAKKENEIIEYLEKIEQLEAKLMKLGDLIPEADGEKKWEQKKVGSKLAIKLKDKNNKIRELKHKIDSLRKEKVQEKRKYRIKYKEVLNQYTRNCIPRAPSYPGEFNRGYKPFNALGRIDLQEVVFKKRLIIKDFEKFNEHLREMEKFNEQLRRMDLEGSTELLKSEISDLNKKIEELSSASENKKGIRRDLFDDDRVFGRFF